jgi:tRNA A22 N-methylase
MIGWVTLSIMILQGLSLQSKHYTPIVWNQLFNVAKRWPLCYNVGPIRFHRPKKHYSFATKVISSDEVGDIHLAKNAFDVLAKKSKSWMRLGTIVDLALDESFSKHQCSDKKVSICDVGTDHGLLATGLAMTSRFDRVLGVDVSQEALRDGALKLQNDIRTYRKRTTNNTPSHIEKRFLPEFRLSDGLQNVQIGEADIVCVAGMGVHTMVDILTATRRSKAQQKSLLLDVLETRRLIVQPTNCRPRLLWHLYRHLYQIGWRVKVERINFVSSRWYFTVELERSNNTVIQIPGTLAMTSNASQVTIDWVAHHRNWIRSDSSKTGSMNQNDELWLKEFDVL